MSSLPPRLTINPPLFNSANPWATTLEQLRALYECPSTGAVTTRTALLEGFGHDDNVHQFVFFGVGTHRVCTKSGEEGGDAEGEGEGKEDGKGNGGGQGGREGGRDGKGDGRGYGDGEADASLNNLGYSPIPLDGYVEFIRKIDEEATQQEKKPRKPKPLIISVTGTPDEVAECYARISALAEILVHRGGTKLAMEVNLSCPNIPGKPPPAYESGALGGYLRRIAEAASGEEGKGVKVRVPWGLKTPPYTHAGQFDMFISALRESATLSSDGNGDGVCPVSFVTATNTLGSCLVLTSSPSPAPIPALPHPGLGGLAGAPLHPLALGNVATLRRMLDAAPETRHISVLGIGGVSDAAGYLRMRSVGADAVGVGTALGGRGMGVFADIERGLGGWEI
ncbi:hypothetical protein F4777DRAFT_185821 [Nemania sp. FL0916]|nr:hypothetical protein F4777DRAFT_185821 [Nemania sp. FL0916]